VNLLSFGRPALSDDFKKSPGAAVLSRTVQTCQAKDSSDRQRSSTTQKEQASEVYERPQVVPKMGNPNYRITWTLDQEAIVTLARFEENLRGNQ